MISISRVGNPEVIASHVCCLLELHSLHAKGSANNTSHVMRDTRTRARTSKRCRNVFLVAACHRSFETARSAKQCNAGFAKPLVASFKTLTSPPSSPPNLGWPVRGHAPLPRMTDIAAFPTIGQAVASCRVSRVWLPSGRFASYSAPSIAPTGVVKDPCDNPGCRSYCCSGKS